MSVSHHPARRAPNAVDIAIGQRLKAARTLAGWSQIQLGAGLGISFQQVQKYEKGLNRIGGSRLQQIAGLLNVTPAFFFGDAPAGAEPSRAAQSLAEQNAQAASQALAELDLGGRNRNRDLLTLVSSFRAIPSPTTRRAVLELMRALAGGELDVIVGTPNLTQLAPVAAPDQLPAEFGAIASQEAA